MFLFNLSFTLSPVGLTLYFKGIVTAYLTIYGYPKLLTNLPLFNV